MTRYACPNCASTVNQPCGYSMLACDVCGTEFSECAETDTSRSDGSTAKYYELPEGAKEIQDLISYKNMNAQMGEIMRSSYRYGESSHSDMLRDAKKIRFYINAEIERLEKYGEDS